MTCRELVDLITDYVEGTLPESDRRRFESHLAECRYCRAYADQMRATIARLGERREESLSPATRERLLAGFRAERGSAGRLSG